MDSHLAVRAFTELYGEQPTRQMIVKYHGRLRGYNATVVQTSSAVTFRLSSRLQECEPEIKIGIMQHLLNKLRKTKVQTDNIEFYQNFLKRMSDYAPVTKNDPLLAASFSRVNEQYFHGMMSRPNLVWGRKNHALLGTYEYGTDTITLSTVLLDTPEELLDYVMYHEMLHKKHKFSCSSGRTHAHTPAFKRDEAKFHVREAERQLQGFLRGEARERPTFLQRVMGWR